MKMFSYAIFDSAAGAYMRPFVARSDDEAAREFHRLTNGESIIADYPQNYTLFRVATWDDTTGEMQQMGPEKLHTAMELIAANNLAQSQRELFNDENQSPGATA